MNVAPLRWLASTAIVGVLLQEPFSRAQNQIAPVSVLTGGVSVKPAVEFAFVPLKPGAIRPTGWLDDWARAAGDGVTGHLDERSAVFEKCYQGVHFEAEGVQPGGCGWPLEQGAYWLDGLVRLAFVLDDKALIEKASSRLDRVVEGVHDGGESLIYWQPKTVLEDTFNNWAHSHIGRALVAYYQATGDARILDALVKVYRDYPLPDLPTQVFDPVSGACNLDPMLETYRLSGDAKILENALAYAARDAFENVTNEWVAGNSPDGHGVIFLENVRVPALLYPWTGQRRRLEATLRPLRDKFQRHGLPSGLMSAEEYLAGVGSTRSTETCNIAASLWTHHWLLRITGESANADQMERILFNAGPVPLSRDFKLVSYYQTPNRDGKSLPGEQPAFGGYAYSELARGPLCCVGNSSRIIPSYVMHMWMSTPDQGLAATLYGPARVCARVAFGTLVVIDARTNYPFEETIEMTVRPDQTVRFPLYLRIPGWCDEAEIRVNDRRIAAAKSIRGFVKIDRRWRMGDRVQIRLPMRVRIGVGRESPFPDTQIAGHSYFVRALAKRGEVQAPYACVNLGPLLFALAIPDKSPNEPIDGVKWNYALNVEPGNALAEVEVSRSAMPEHWHWQLAQSPVKLRVPAVEFAWNPSGARPLPEEPVEGGESAHITLAPYACTKFRISMFPVTKRLWEAQSRSTETHQGW